MTCFIKIFMSKIYTVYCKGIKLPVLFLQRCSVVPPPTDAFMLSEMVSDGKCRDDILTPLPIKYVSNYTQ